MDSSDATGLLREVGLRPGVFRFEWSRDYGTGTVIGLDPPPGSRVERRSRVDLTISTGRFR
jgi:beta-lactam-binding protein with PASTA domain